MAQIKNVLFGKLAVSTRFITEEQLQECLDFQKEMEERGEKPPRLGEILEQKGYLTKQQIQSILETMSSMQRRRFGEIAVAFHFITLEQLETCLDIQKLLQSPQETVPLFGQALVTYRNLLKSVLAGGTHPKIGDVLCAMGYMRGHQVEAVLEEQNKRIVRCKSCEASLNISKFVEGQKIKCGQCNAVLSIVKIEGGEELDVMLPVDAAAEGAANTGEAAEDQPLDPKTALFELDKAMAERRATQTQEMAKPEKTPGRIADFQVITRLGQDSTGVIFKATQVSKNRPVALKIMNPSVMNDPNFQKKFIEDAKKVASIDHPNIKKVFALGKSENRFYIAMEFVEAESIYNILEKQGKFHFETALNIMVSLAEALQYANQTHGLIHGDIRPSNILILKDGTVKLSNLGLATKITENILAISRSGQMAPFYIAPECVTGDREMDHRTDIYSLGATLFHMVAGRPPFQGQSPFEVLVRLTEETIPPLKFFDPTIPDSVCRVVERMLEAEPQDRYQTWEELISDARAVLTSGALASGGHPSAAPTASTATSQGTVVIPPKPVTTAEDAKIQYERRNARAAQMRSLRRGAAVLVGVAVLVGGGLLVRNSLIGAERVEAWSDLKAKVDRDGTNEADFTNKGVKLGEFIRAFPDSPEASEAQRALLEIPNRLSGARAVELKSIETQVNTDIAAGKFGDALKKLESPSFHSKDQIEIRRFDPIIRDAAKADWDKLRTAVLAKSAEGKHNEGRALIEDRMRFRLLKEDADLKTALLLEIKESEDAARALLQAKKDQELQESSRKLIDETIIPYRKSLAKQDAESALSLVEGIKNKVHEKHFPEIEAMYTQAQWAQDMRNEATNTLLDMNAQSSPPQVDKRFKAKMSNGLEGRVINGDPAGITVRDDKSGASEAKVWTAIDRELWSDIMRGSLARKNTPKMSFALGQAYFLRAEGGKDEDRFPLMQRASTAFGNAVSGGLGKESKEYVDAIEKYFGERKQNVMAEAKGFITAGKFTEARAKLRSLQNVYSAGELASEQAQVDKLWSEAMAAGGAGKYVDFAAGFGPVVASAGWNAAGGVLKGNGKNETLDISGAHEIAMLVRFDSLDFTLTIDVGTAKLTFAPAEGSSGRYELDLKQADGTLAKRLPLRDKVKGSFNTGKWHVLEVREIAPSAAGGATGIAVFLDGVLLTPVDQEMIAPASNTRVELGGKSKNAAGAIEIDNLYVK